MQEVAPGKFFRHLGRPAGEGAFPFRVQFECLDIVDARRSHVVAPHRHDHWEIIAVDGGTYRFRHNGAAAALQRGGLLALKPGDLHEDCCDGPVAFSALRLRLLPGPTRERSATLFADGAPDAAQRIAAGDGACHRIVRRIAEAGGAADPFLGHRLDALAMEFVWELARLLPVAALAPRLVDGLAAHGFAAELLRLCDRTHGRRLGLRAMAAELGISERTLSARCRAAFGCSPTRLHVRRTMEHARDLLVGTDLTVKAISAHLGFENPYHFSTVYKRVHGVAPTRERG